MQNRANVTLSGKKLKADDEANPCGLLARNFPNDRFLSLELKDGDKTEVVPIDYISKDLKLEKSVDFVLDRDLQWTDVSDPLFYNWMVSF